MRIKFHKKFEKQYKKLPNNIKKKTRRIIELFIKEPNHCFLKNHSLKGKLAGLRAIAVTGDIRMVFKQEDDYLLVIFLSIGGHDQTYK